jgi:hypothetical protein
MERTWKPTTAGVLCIIIGAIGCLGGLTLALTSNHISAMYGVKTMGIIMAASFPAIALSIVTLIGGIFSIKRKIWGLALAGSICCLLLNFIFGIPSIIFLVSSKNEFE